MVDSIKYVDEVNYEFEWEQKSKDIKELQKDNNEVTLFMGDDWKGKFDDLPCEVIYLPRTENISSTLLREVIQNAKTKRK